MEPNTPLLLLYTVSSFQIKEEIMKVLFTKKEDIQFHHDCSVQDHEKYEQRVEKLKECATASDQNLVIHNFKIVKNLPCLHLHLQKPSTSATMQM